MKRLYQSVMEPVSYCESDAVLFELRSSCDLRCHDLECMTVICKHAMISTTMCIQPLARQLCVNSPSPNDYNPRPNNSQRLIRIVDVDDRMLPLSRQRQCEDANVMKIHTVMDFRM